jgi:AraC-like DNA-binding protein
MCQLQFGLINAFPDFTEKDFRIKAYNQQFREKNIVIHARSKSVHYPVHWGPLSIKCAFNGSENYLVNNCELAVNDSNYLVLNNGNYYSSFIETDSDVRSFTINFTEALVKDAVVSFAKPDSYLLDNAGYCHGTLEFYETLQPHDQVVSPMIYRLGALTDRFEEQEDKVEETYLLLIQRLIEKQNELEQIARQIPVMKLSTKRELFKRLRKAKDYLDSCYMQNISIAKLSSVCFLNQTYFLRQFKNVFDCTPRQYIIQKRMAAAKTFFDTQRNISVTDVCLRVGYNDLASFSKLFKSFYKVSPESYRKGVKK